MENNLPSQATEKPSNNLINEINKLKASIATLQQQIETQKTLIFLAEALPKPKMK
jgi:hypothetical protein